MSTTRESTEHMIVTAAVEVLRDMQIPLHADMIAKIMRAEYKGHLMLKPGVFFEPTDTQVARALARATSGDKAIPATSGAAIVRESPAVYCWKGPWYLRQKPRSLTGS